MGNEQIKDALDALVESCSGLMPRIVEYEIHSSTMWAILWTFITAVSIAVIIAIYGYSRKKKANGEHWDDFPIVVGCAIATVLALVGLTVVFVEINDIYTAKYLPEKMFMRYVRSVLENGL